MNFCLSEKIEAKLYFLDRNIMSFIREYNERQDMNKIRRNDKKEIILKLKSEDKKFNQFTPLLSIIEGCKIGQENDSEEIYNNLNIEIQELKVFFQNAYILLPNKEVLLSIISSYRHKDDIGRLVNFLYEANLSNQVPQKDRKNKVNEILNIALKNNIEKYHPIVIAVLIWIYGNESIQKILKFGQNKNREHFYNPVMDIYNLYRFSRLVARNNDSKYKHALEFKFMTHDKGLEEFYKYFDFSKIVFREGDSDIHIPFSKYGEKILPKEILSIINK